MDTMFSRLRCLLVGGLVAGAAGCASEEPLQTGMADGGLVRGTAGFWSPSGGMAGEPLTGSGGGDLGGGGTAPGGTGGAGLAPGSGGSPSQTGGYGGASPSGGAFGASGGTIGAGTGGACLLGPFCPATGGAGGLGGTGGSGGVAGQGGSAGGADMCANETCFDIFDCFLYFANATTCGFTKCEGLICKK
jgi:hypothetical protein